MFRHRRNARECARERDGGTQTQTHNRERDADKQGFIHGFFLDGHVGTTAKHQQVGIDGVGMWMYKIRQNARAS